MIAKILLAAAHKPRTVQRKAEDNHLAVFGRS